VQPNGSGAVHRRQFQLAHGEWYDPNIRMPYVMSWSGGMQYEFSHNWLDRGDLSRNGRRRAAEQLGHYAIPLNISSDPRAEADFSGFADYKPYPQFGSVKLYSNFGPQHLSRRNTLRVERRFTAG